MPQHLQQADVEELRRLISGLKQKEKKGKYARLPKDLNVYIYIYVCVYYVCVCTMCIFEQSVLGVEIGLGNCKK